MFGTKSSKASPYRFKSVPKPVTPPTTTNTVQQNDKNPSIMTEFAGSLVSGFGVGAGASLADRAISTVLGPRTFNVVHKEMPKNEESCSDLYKQYCCCVNSNNNCSDLLYKVNQCFEKLINEK